MKVIAKSKYIRQSPRKIRLVADQLRKRPVEEAIVLLENLNRRAAKPILLTLKQGVANAVNNFDLKKENLKIDRLEVGEGPRQKRMDKSHRSFRWGTIQKKTAHLRIVLEGEKEAKPKPKLKPKARLKTKAKVKSSKKPKLISKMKGRKNGSKS